VTRVNQYQDKDPQGDGIQAPFGTVFAPLMALARFAHGKWSEVDMVSSEELTLHPATHVLHYASTCFEGLKAYRHDDGEIHVFRMEANVARMQQSARLLHLPEPGHDRLRDMIVGALRANRSLVPSPPGAMYIRPTLLGTEISIGSAAAPSTEALLYVLLSPVGDYFSGGARPLRILVDDLVMRTAPHAGMIKAGGNYASALPHIMKAKAEHQADQVLFCPGGFAQETGAANFLLLDDERIVTRALDETFLHGVTRDSILKLGARLGYVVEERNIPVGEILEWAKKGEAALSGTAVVLSGIGEFIFENRTVRVGNGQIGPNTKRLREALLDIQLGRAEDPFGWVEKV
jgi:branched-chain amino acid aminotransferase